MFISKESYNKGEPINVNPESVQKVLRPVRAVRFLPAPHRADSGNLRNFEATYRRGTVFAPKQCSYQKEAIRKAQKCKP